MGSTEVKRMAIGTQMHPTHNYTVIHSRTLNKIMEKILYCDLYIFPSKQLVAGRQRLHRLFKKSFCMWNRLLEKSHSHLLIVDLYILLTLFCASGDMTRKTRSQDEFSAMPYLMSFPFGDVFCHSTFKYKSKFINYVSELHKRRCQIQLCKSFASSVKETLHLKMYQNLNPRGGR